MKMSKVDKNDVDRRDDSRNSSDDRNNKHKKKKNSALDMLSDLF